MADCSFLSTDIKQCQSKGKIVTLSLGGGISQVGFNSDSQAAGFATNIWNMFLGSSVFYSCSPFRSLHSRRKYVGIISSDFNLIINRWWQKTIWQSCSGWVHAAFHLLSPQISDIANSVDLDIESGPSAHYNTFVNTLRSLAKGAPKK